MSHRGSTQCRSADGIPSSSPGRVDPISWRKKIVRPNYNCVTTELSSPITDHAFRYHLRYNRLLFGSCILLYRALRLHGKSSLRDSRDRDLSSWWTVIIIIKRLCIHYAEQTASGTQSLSLLDDDFIWTASGISYRIDELSIRLTVSSSVTWHRVDIHNNNNYEIINFHQDASLLDPAWRLDLREQFRIDSCKLFKMCRSNRKI